MTLDTEPFFSLHTCRSAWIRGVWACRLVGLQAALMAEEATRNFSGELPPGVKSFTVGGYPMAYAESGMGPRVVLVHGVLADYRYWEPQLVTLLFIDSVNEPGTWKSRPALFRQIARDNVWTISRQETDIESMGVAGVAKLKMPALLIGGEKSPQMFAEILDAIEKVLPSPTRETLPHAGHQVSRDNPTAFDRALLGFLSK